MSGFTLDQYKQAFQAANAAGDKQSAEKIYAAYTQMAASQAHVDPTEGMSGGAKFVSGIGQGMTNVARHAGNLIGMVDDASISDAKARDADLLNTGAGKAGAFVGEMAATAPLTGGAVGILGRAGGLGAKIAGNSIARGVTEGAVQGGVMGDPGNRLEGAALGGALGGVLPTAARAGSKVVNGMTRTPEAQALLNAGVDLTPGQMNPGGMMNQVEEAWQSVPGVGSVVRGARDNAQQSFQRVATQAAAAPGAHIASKEAGAMLDDAYRSFEPLYDQAKGFPVRPYVMTTTSNKPLVSLFKSTLQSKSIPATAEARARAGSIIDNEMSSGVGSSDDLLRIRSNLRAAERKARSSNETLQHDTADLLEAADKHITDALESQLPPDAMTALRTADAQYGLYKTVEKAVAGAKDKPGGFTAADLSRAVADGMKGQNAGTYARGGGGPLRNLSSAGTASMNVRSPATGARLAAIGLPSALGAAAPVVGIPAGAAMLGLVGTKTGRKLAAGSTSGQQAAQRAIGRFDSAVPKTYQDLLAEYLNRAAVTGPLIEQR